MKNTFKVLGVIVLLAIIGFSMAACSDKSNDGGGNNQTTPTTPTNPTTPPVTQLSGTYYYGGGLSSITFSGFNWSGYAFIEVEISRGTYKINGSKVTMTITWVNNSLGPEWTGMGSPGEIYYMTIINDTTLKDDDSGEYFYKQ
jgi:hypothetical protein